eukprot:4871930-Lingulodinium_polyedra.AAC.1
MVNTTYCVPAHVAFLIAHACAGWARSAANHWQYRYIAISHASARHACQHSLAWRARLVSL